MWNRSMTSGILLTLKLHEELKVKRIKSNSKKQWHEITLRTALTIKNWKCKTENKNWMEEI